MPVVDAVFQCRLASCYALITCAPETHPKQQLPGSRSSVTGWHRAHKVLKVHP